MITEQKVKDFIKNSTEDYVKVYEQRFHKVAKKAFLDGMYNMAGFIESDGDYQLEWGDPEDFRAIKLRNDIDNAVGFPLSLNQYQDKAMSTCMQTCSNFSYMMLNLVGEVGEFASKIAKAVRKETGMMDGPNFYYYKYQDEGVPSSEVLYEELKKEAGDILWQLSGLCTVMGWTLEDVAQKNLDKLASRKQRGVIDGDGDNR